MKAAIEMAKAQEVVARKEWLRGFRTGYAPTEMQSYVLYVCGKLEGHDCVFAVASSPTASDFAPLVKASNLALLAGKYEATGFVVKRTPNGKEEWTYLPVKAKGGSCG